MPTNSEYTSAHWFAYNQASITVLFPLQNSVALGLNYLNLTIFAFIGLKRSTPKWSAWMQILLYIKWIKWGKLPLFS